MGGQEQMTACQSRALNRHRVFGPGPLGIGVDIHLAGGQAQNHKPGGVSQPLLASLQSHLGLGPGYAVGLHRRQESSAEGLEQSATRFAALQDDEAPGLPVVR